MAPRAGSARYPACASACVNTAPSCACTSPSISAFGVLRILPLKSIRFVLPKANCKRKARTSIRFCTAFCPKLRDNENRSERLGWSACGSASKPASCTSNEVNNSSGLGCLATADKLVSVKTPSGDMSGRPDRAISLLLNCTSGAGRRVKNCCNSSV